MKKTRKYCALNTFWGLIGAISFVTASFKNENIFSTQEDMIWFFIGLAAAATTAAYACKKIKHFKLRASVFVYSFGLFLLATVPEYSDITSVRYVIAIGLSLMMTWNVGHISKNAEYADSAKLKPLKQNA